MNTHETDVLVVGSGPAGLAAAIELRKWGAGKVLVVDREVEPGGIPRHCHHTGFGIHDFYRLLTGPDYARRYVDKALATGVTIQTETTITGWHSDLELNSTSTNGITNIKAQAVVLATGCRERPRTARLIPGSRPVGIYTTGALQNMVYHQLPIGQRALVIGADHVGFSAIMTLRDAGVEVIGIVTKHMRHQTYWPYKLLSADRYRVPLLAQMQVTGIEGKQRVETVELTHVTDGTKQRIECDTVVFTGDWIPDNELSYQGGLEMDTHSKSPCVNLRLQTSRRGVFAAGNLVHAAETASRAALSGRYAARQVCDWLETGIWIENPAVPIRLEGPLCWVSPHLIQPGQRHAPQGHFILRVREILAGPLLTVRQGQRQLWQQRYRQLIPNLPIHMPDYWLADVQDGDTPIHIHVDRD